MLKELYAAVVEDTKKSVVPKLIDLPGGKVLLYAPGSSPEVMPKDKVLHSDSVSSTDSMLDWCMRHDESDLVVKVFAHHIEVAAGRDFAHLLNAVRFALAHTKAMSDLLAWVERPRTQQQVVAAMRTSLAGTFDEPKILPIFRRLDFNRKNDGSKSINHTGESLGKSIEARAQSANGDIPETLLFDLDVYSNILAPTVTLRFALDVDASQELIKIAPVGDCITDAYNECSRAIVADLKHKMPKALVLCCD
jgi:hypothetical protein